jgi:hypothetical protein
MPLFALGRAFAAPRQLQAQPTSSERCLLVHACSDAGGVAAARGGGGGRRAAVAASRAPPTAAAAAGTAGVDTAEAPRPAKRRRTPEEKGERGSVGPGALCMQRPRLHPTAPASTDTPPRPPASPPRAPARLVAARPVARRRGARRDRGCRGGGPQPRAGAGRDAELSLWGLEDFSARERPQVGACNGRGLLQQRQGGEQKAAAHTCGREAVALPLHARLSPPARPQNPFPSSNPCRWSLDDHLTAVVALQEAAAAPGGPPRAALDLGCGCGSVLLMLAWGLPGARVVGVEAQVGARWGGSWGFPWALQGPCHQTSWAIDHTPPPPRLHPVTPLPHPEPVPCAQAVSAGLAARSIAYNLGATSDRARVIPGDLRAVPGSLPPAALPPGGRFGLVTGTPPYIPPGAGAAPRAGRPQKAGANLEGRGGVEDYVAAAARVLAPDGAFVVVMVGGRAWGEGLGGRASAGNGVGDGQAAE